MAHHGLDSASDGRQTSDGPSDEPLKENFLDSKVTAKLIDLRSSDGPSLVHFEGDFVRPHWIKAMARMTDYREIVRPLR
ncbi:hypothetical protein HAX54_004977, partial [Datura stramonium]|nr:hypothetical protein [Datura stramonium]